jgi:hypothetical protein
MRDARGLVLLFPMLLGLLGLAAPAWAADPSAAECSASDQKAAELESLHKLLEARGELATCSAPTCPADVRDGCARRAKDLAGRVPTVALEIKGASGRDLGRIVVTLDGEPLPAGLDKLDGVEIELDPGDHVVTLRAPGDGTSGGSARGVVKLAAIERRFTVHEGEKKREPVDLGSATTPSPVAPITTTVGGILVQFYSPSDRWADGRWALVDKEHALLCPFPCLHAVAQHSGLEVRRVPPQYGRDEEFYPLPETFSVPPGERGRIVVSQARLLGTYGRWGSIFPLLVGVPVTIAGMYLGTSVSSLSTGQSAVFTKGEAVGLSVGLTVLGTLLVGGGITWLVLARDPQVSIVPESAR